MRAKDFQAKGIRKREVKKPEIVIENTLPLNGDEPLFEEIKTITEMYSGRYYY